MHVKTLQEPDCYGCQENDGEGPLQEILCFVPQKMTYIFGARHPVVWKFHHKRNGFAAEHGVSHEQCHENTHKNTAEVQGNHDQCTVLREKSGRKECINRKLCRAAHKWREQDGHFTVTFRWKRPACHNAGNRAAKTDEHGNNASS